MVIMDNMKVVNLYMYTDFNMVKRVNRLAMTLSLQTVAVMFQSLGSFSNDDGDGNKNVKTEMGLLS